MTGRGRGKKVKVNTCIERKSCVLENGRFSVLTLNNALKSCYHLCSFLFC